MSAGKQEQDAELDREVLRFTKHMPAAAKQLLMAGVTSARDLGAAQWLRRH